MGRRRREHRGQHAQAQAGTSAGDPIGTDAFDPASEWDGFALDSFDGLGEHQAEPGNRAPTAVDDAAGAAEDGGPIRIDVLANDTDPDGDSLALDGFGQGEHGSVVATADGTALLYEPAPDCSGSDSFGYTVGDGHGGSAAATVALSVSAANDAPVARDDAAAVDEDGSVAVAVLANDTDVDGDPLAITGATQAASGEVAVTPDGSGLTYTPAADATGQDSFGYTVGDGQGGSATASVSVSIAPQNDPPTVADDSATTVAATPVSVAVLANDTDVDGDPLTVQESTQGAAGSVAIDPDGTLTYTANDGFSGTDSFTYTVADGAGGADTATVTVEVSETPGYDFSASSRRFATRRRSTTRRPGRSSPCGSASAPRTARTGSPTAIRALRR
jgi:hypothetical protein